MDPTEKLGSPKTFFTQTFTKNGQTFQVKIEKVGRHGERFKSLSCKLRAGATQMQLTGVNVHAWKEEADFNGSSFCGV
jgi:hypothetical protein